SYGAPFFWILAGGIWALVTDAVLELEAHWRILRAATLTAAFSPCIVGPLWSADFAVMLQWSTRAAFWTVVQSTFKSPDPDRWFKTTRQPPPMKEFTTESGVALKVPTGVSGRCWNTAGLCTPNPAPNLRLRVPGDVSRGFAVDGAWRMI